jgi:hypothetical protein
VAAEPLSPDDHLSTKRILTVFFVAVGAGLFLLSAAQFRKFDEIPEGVALFGAASLAILSAAVVAFTRSFCNLTVRSLLSRVILAAVAIGWIVWIAAIVYTYRAGTVWDEGAYLLSGMALRGYQVPYAVERPPVTNFLTAVFVDHSRFLNPVLLVALLTLMWLWVRRLIGPLAAALCLFVLLCQNLFLESTVIVMSELPAALFMLAGFFSLSRERLWWCALWFALIVFTRWLLAPVTAVVCLAILIRFGARQAAKLPAVAFALFIAWYGLTISMGAPRPIAAVYQGNFLPALVWSANPNQQPTPLLRADFYVKNYFFLTPPILCALMLSPIFCLRKQLSAEHWTLHFVLPVALLAYLVSLLAIGGLFPRFVTPFLPVAVVSFFFLLSTLGDNYALSVTHRIWVGTILLFVTCAVGLVRGGDGPLGAAVRVRNKFRSQPVFSLDFRTKLINLEPKIALHGVPRNPLSNNNGYQAMLEARHVVLFPTARQKYPGGIIEESDSVETVRKLRTVCSSGDLLIIPRAYTTEFQANLILAFDDHWALVSEP